MRQHKYIDDEFQDYQWIVNHPFYFEVYGFVSNQFKLIDKEIIDTESKYLCFLIITSMLGTRDEEAIRQELLFFKTNKVSEYNFVRNLQRSLINKYQNEYQIMSSQLTYLLTGIIISQRKFTHQGSNEKIQKYLHDEVKNAPNFYTFMEKELLKQRYLNLTESELDRTLASIIPILKANIPIMKYEKPITIGFFYSSDITHQYLVRNKITEHLDKRISFNSNEYDIQNMDIVVVDEKSYKGVKQRVADDASIISIDNITIDNSIKKLEFAIMNIQK
ncbi:hypothetical protein [Companilactobacillus sp. RD055328]|uniref:hypothetical protein n=1 Tax=Companilactobacillus sp. RD055328 TaxID=2916634 RepID=UPI001FC8A046|nr:hypothetical protein [Companilactobacillus sp. RD055328]